MNRSTVALTVVLGVFLCIPVFSLHNAGIDKSRNPGKQTNTQFFGPQTDALMDLGLNDVQKQKLETVRRNYLASIGKTVKSNATPTQKMTEIKKLRREAENDIRAFLTAKQIQSAEKSKLFNILLGGGPNAFQKIMAQLNLSNKQKSEINDIVQAQLMKRQEVHNNVNLTTTQKREIMKPYSRGELFKKINKVLTAKQRNKFKELLKQPAPGDWNFNVGAGNFDPAAK